VIVERQGHAGTAEKLLEQAITMARGQGARLYELRAAHELASLLVRRGERGVARRILAEACDGIRGGASIACVTEARELLLALA
jgi:hypothetical protein